MATQGLYRFTLVCAIIAFVFMFVAFASPYWYQSWRRVHSSFGNIGLWHICLNGYIMPRDPVMKSYVGCWWIHSTEFSLVKDHIQPGKKGFDEILVFSSYKKSEGTNKFPHFSFLISFGRVSVYLYLLPTGTCVYFRVVLRLTML